MQPYNHFEYGEMLARQLRAIAHTDKEQHYYRATEIEDLQELNARLSGARGMILVAIDDCNSDFGWKNSDSLMERPQYFFVVAKATPGNDKSSQEAAAEAIENNIRKKIVERQIVNPLYYEKMSAILQRLINDRKNGVIAYKSLLDKYIDLLKKTENPEENEVFPLSVRHSAAKRAFYMQFGEDGELANKLYNAVVNSKQDDFRGNIVKIRRIKKALSHVLKDESDVEKAYELINVQKEF